MRVLGYKEMEDSIMTRQDVEAASDIIMYTLQHFLELDTESQTVILACVMAFAETVKPMYVGLKQSEGGTSKIVYRFKE